MPRSGAKTAKDILDAANRIVQQQGVERLTLEQTAREAGVSKGGLLYHFPSKEALIEGMIRYYLERFSQDYEEAHAEDSAERPGQWTRAYLHTTYADKERIPSMSSGLLAAIATNPTLLAPMQRGFEEWVNRLEDDGIDPTIATVIRLAVDGLWLVELFGLAQPDPQRRQEVLAVLDALTNKKIDD
jgi:AcrR family transcriptional regulator